MIQDVVGAEAQVFRLREEVVLEIAELAFTVAIAGSFEMTGLHECTDATPGLQSPGAFKRRINFSHRIRIDSQLDRKLADGGQLIADNELPGRDRKAYRSLELMMQRRRMPAVDVKRETHCPIVLWQ